MKCFGIHARLNCGYRVNNNPGNMDHLLEWKNSHHYEMTQQIPSQRNGINPFLHSLILNNRLVICTGETILLRYFSGIF